MRNGFLATVVFALLGSGPAFAQSVPLDASSMATAPTVYDTDAPIPASALPVQDPPDWLTVDNLLWFPKKQNVPVPLVTTGTTTNFGILNQPGTSVVAGNSSYTYPIDYGLRLSAGAWVDDNRLYAIDGNFFYMFENRAGESFASDSTGSQIFARPVVNALTNTETAQLVTFPNAFNGGVDISTTTRLMGAELNLLRNLARRSWWSADFLIGFRYLDLNEDLTINQGSGLLTNGTSGFNGTPVFPPNVISIMDDFNCRNTFFGAQIGGRANIRRNRFDLELLGKFAFGDMNQQTTITGSTTQSNASGSNSVPGGLLALRTNEGTYSFHEYAAIPEARITLAYQATRHCKASIGYNFLYISDVMRPGDQLSRVVNPTYVPSSLSYGSFFGPGQPLAPNVRSSFYTHGFNLGLSFVY